MSGNIWIYIAVMAAVTCVLAPLSFSVTSIVPLSLATFAVMLSGILLGGLLGKNE